MMAPLADARGRASVQGAALCVDWPAQHVMRITLDRPGELNALSLGMIGELRDAFAIASRERAAAVIVTGTGRAFCAGADLKEVRSKEAGLFESPMAFRDRYLAPLAALFDAMEEMPFPIVAAINGYALGGGCEMALSADLRLMSSTASLGLPEVQLGAIPGAGGVQKLIRHVGRSKALEWILMASRIDAEEAQRRGLVLEVTEPGRLQERALAVAVHLSGLGPQALAQAKASIYLSEDADLRTARRFGLEALTSLASTEEWREGLSAFLEKRAPRFR